MKILTFLFETRLEFSEPVSNHDFVLRCLPSSTPRQTVLDAQIMVEPPAQICEQVDGFGNRLQVGRLAAPHDGFTFVGSGTVATAGDVDGAPEPCHPVFLRPSELTFAGPAVAEFASDVLRVCPNLGPWEKAELLSRELGTRMTYERGSTGVRTTAEEALAGGRGVCQDYAHVLIAACRQAGVAARYVNGLMLGEGETHAWVEVHDGRRWRGIDPANQKLADCDYITLSCGRDFADCPIERGVLTGGARQSQSVRVRVTDDAAWAALGTYD